MFFSGEDVELEIRLDPSVSVAPGRGCPNAPGPSISIGVDAAEVHWLPLMVHLPPSTETSDIEREMRGALARTQRASADTLNLADFLLALRRAKVTWVESQVLGQLGAFIDAELAGKGFVADPLAAEEDEPSIPLGCRRDEYLAKKICLGEGLGVDGKRAHLQGPFVDAFHSLTRPGKAMRRMDVRDVNTDIILRQLQAAQNHFRQARHVNLSSDGTHIGGKEIVWVAAGARAAEGVHRTTWLLQAR